MTSSGADLDEKRAAFHSHLQKLGLAEDNYSRVAIKQAYFNLAVKYHPQNNAGLNLPFAVFSFIDVTGSFFMLDNILLCPKCDRFGCSCKEGRMWNIWNQRLEDVIFERLDDNFINGIFEDCVYDMAMLQGSTHFNLRTGTFSNRDVTFTEEELKKLHNNEEWLKPDHSESTKKSKRRRRKYRRDETPVNSCQKSSKEQGIDEAKLEEMVSKIIKGKASKDAKALNNDDRRRTTCSIDKAYQMGKSQGLRKADWEEVQRQTVATAEVDRDYSDVPLSKHEKRQAKKEQKEIKKQRETVAKNYMKHPNKDLGLLPGQEDDYDRYAKLDSASTVSYKSKDEGYFSSLVSQASLTDRRHRYSPHSQTSPSSSSSDLARTSESSENSNGSLFSLVESIKAAKLLTRSRRKRNFVLNTDISDFEEVRHRRGREVRTGENSIGRNNLSASDQSSRLSLRGGSFADVASGKRTSGTTQPERSEDDSRGYFMAPVNQQDEDSQLQEALRRSKLDAVPQKQTIATAPRASVVHERLPIKPSPETQQTVHKQRHVPPVERYEPPAIDQTPLTKRSPATRSNDGYTSSRRDPPSVLEPTTNSPTSREDAYTKIHVTSGRLESQSPHSSPNRSVSRVAGRS